MCFYNSPTYSPCIYSAVCVIQFYEAGELHKRQEAELKARLRELENQSEQHQAVISGLNAKYTDTIERLQSDKARLEVSGTSRMRLADVSAFKSNSFLQQLSLFYS